MPDSPQPPRKIPSKLPPPGTKPGSSKAAASSDGSRSLPPAKPRAVKKPAAPADEQDEFDQPIKRKLPPVVVKKKVKAKRDPDERQRPSGPETPASEFLAPLILIAVSLVLDVVVTMMFPLEGISAGAWLAIRLGLVAVSTVITIGALFLAAAVLDTDFGFFHTACLKVAAITLTQAWVEDLADMIPLPLVPWLITTLVTYSLFKYFFELDEMEIIYSIVIIRFVHWVVMVLAIVAVVAVIVGGVAGVPDGMLDDPPPDDAMPFVEPADPGDLPGQDDAAMDDGGDDF